MYLVSNKLVLIKSTTLCINFVLLKKPKVLFTGFSVNPLIFVTTLIHILYSGLWLNVGWRLGDGDRCLGLRSTGTGGDV